MNAARFSLTGVAALLLFAGALSAQPGGEPRLPEDVQKAKDQLREHLTKLGDKGQGLILWLSSKPLPQLLPNQHLFAVRYRVFPVARILPKGLRASNVFAVSREGTLTHVKDVKDLQAFFRKNLPAVKDEKTARNAVTASLILSQEFRQDGFFKFNILDDSTKVENKDGGKEATGKAVVMQGGNGELLVNLTFDADGKLSGLTETGKIRSGPRPICQATKLLDADPIVRRMAEQDLLIMGLAARDYLMEQRARANPQLQQAIDRLWQRIVTEGW